MSLFGSHRDDRRRRWLAEDSAAETIAAQASVAPKTAARPQRYHPAAQRENHRRISDLAPRSLWTIAMCFAGCLALIAGLLAVSAWIEDAATLRIAGAAQLLDAPGPGSLLSWFSSLMFLLAAAGSILIYRVRRHKIDDYRGRYRLWLWCALAWLVMSIDATANLHVPFAHAMAMATGWSLSGDPTVWWIGVWGSILGVLGLRLVFETRECRWAMCCVAAVALLWTAALTIDLAWVRLGAHAELTAIGCRSIGQATLLLAIGCYARYVLLDAEGLLAAAAPKPKREKPARKPKPEPVATKPESDSGKTTRIDAAHTPGNKQGGLMPHVKQVTAGRSAVSVAPSNSGGASFAAKNSHRDDDDAGDDRYESRGSGQRRYDDESDDDYDDGQRKLSKAERKRLRKQMRRQQRDDGE